MPRTEEHEGPEREGEPRGVAVLIQAFPGSSAVPFPAHSTAIGRDWLERFGVTDSKISSRHAALSRPGGVAHVEDAGSRNGTWVNGQRLSGRVALGDGDLLRLGNTILIYRESFVGDLRPAAPVGALVGPYGLRAVAAFVEQAIRQGIPNLLIEGETGTGKELLASALAWRLGRGERLAAINVAALPPNLFEAQLFGHVRGAFSGAEQASPGLVVGAERGAVFLDELGELALDLQPKLLRLLENREILPVGASRPLPVRDVRILAATNQDLDAQVERGLFRRDLLARFAGGRVQIAPLRERREDIPALLVELLRRRQIPWDPSLAEVEAMERLLLHSWLANARELAGLVDSLGPAVLPLKLWAIEQRLGPLPASSGPLTWERVAAAIQQYGSEREAARKLNISRGKLLRLKGRQGE